MKNILLFSFCLITIPSLIILSLIYETEEPNFKFSKNTMVRIYRTKSKRIDVVPLEDYVIGVVAGEMPASFEMEALKAQAVAARSYIMYKIINNQDKEYDVVDTVLNQVYMDDTELKERWGNNYQVNKEKIVNAVKNTAYQYITYNGKVADALFFSTSSGYTENSEDVFVSKVHYLQSVKSEWDEISPVFSEQYEYSYSDFCKMLQIDVTNKIKIDVVDKTDTGKIKKIKINNKLFTGNQVVKLLGLRSSNFTISLSDKVTIVTKGYGHGVGMSQYGAEGMARAGYTYNEILTHYYTDVKIEKIK